MQRILFISAAFLLAIAAGLMSAPARSAEAQVNPDVCNMRTGPDGYWKITSINFNTGAMTSSNYLNEGIENCVGEEGRGVLAQVANRHLIFQRQLCKGSNCSFPEHWTKGYDLDSVNHNPGSSSAGYGSWPRDPDNDGTPDSFEEVAGAIGSARATRNPTDEQRAITLLYRNPDGSSVGSTHYATISLASFEPAKEDAVYGRLKGRNFYALKTDCVLNEAATFVLCNRSSRQQHVSLNADAPARPPGRPSDLSAKPNNRQVTLIWNNPLNPIDYSIIRYEYRRSTDGGNSWSSWRRVNAAYEINHAECPDTGTACQLETVTGLTNGVEVKFEVKSVNVDGESSAREVTETPRIVPPDAPANLRVTTRGSSSISMTWDNPGDTTITKYQRRHKLSSASSYGAWQDIPGSRASTTSYTLSGLQSNSSYAVAIRAVNSASTGNEEGSTVSARTDPARPIRSGGTTTPPPPLSPPDPYGPSIECRAGPDDSVGICALVGEPSTWHWHLRNGRSRNDPNADHKFHNHTVEAGGVGADGHRH